MAKTMREKKAVKKTKGPAKITPDKVVKPNIGETKSRKLAFKLPKFNLKNFNINTLWRTLVMVLIFVLGFSLIDLLVQYLNNGYSMAVVNGTRISKNEFNDRLTKAYGLNASKALIEEELVYQEGKKSNVVVKKEEIQTKITEIETQLGGKEALDQALKANNISITDLERQIELQLIKVAILKPTIQYSEEDLKNFFNQYKEVLYDKDAKYEEKKDDVANRYVEQKTEEAQTSWLENLTANSKIQNNIESKPKYGFLKTTVNIVTNLYNQIKKN